jgi:hypothetical protein
VACTVFLLDEDAQRPLHQPLVTDKDPVAETSDTDRPEGASLHAVAVIASGPVVHVVMAFDSSNVHTGDCRLLGLLGWGLLQATSEIQCWPGYVQDVYRTHMFRGFGTLL